MPYPLVPPPLSDTGAYPYFRQLQKWLDINPISRLTRTQAFITIPAFSVDVSNWIGVSDIVASFNYEGPSNFSLSSIYTEIPLNPDYLMCISWRDNSGHMYRYALWQGVGEVFLFNVPLYTGQAIYQNFRIEIWSVSNQTVASQTAALTLYTSVLGKVDYRWGQDYSLVSADSICTNFYIKAQPIQGLSPQLNPSGVTFGGWMRADTGITSTRWTPINAGAGFFGSYLIPNSVFHVTTDADIRGQDCVTGTLPFAGIGSNTFTPNDIWLLFKYNGDGTIVYMDTTGSPNSSTLSIASGVFSIDGTSLHNTPLTIGSWYILEYWSAGGNGQCNVWPLNTQFSNKAYTSNISVNSRASSTDFLIGGFGDSASIEVTDILVYSSILSTGDQLTNLLYFQDRYESYLLNPLVAPVGSYSQPNQPLFTTLNKNNIPVPAGQVIFASSGGGVQGAG